MTKKTFAVPAMLTAMLFCGSIVAQGPAVDINPKVHPNLNAAQRHVVEAYRAIQTAQRENKWDMKGHAEKAQQLLEEANNELRAAADAANAAGRKR